MKVPFVDLRRQHAALRAALVAEFEGVLDRGDFIFGEAVGSFERRFAEFCGARHAVGVANGTDALIIACRALGIGPGDDVLIPANTFAATAEAVVHAGARPIFVDVDPVTYTIDVEDAGRRLTDRTKAVMAVHLYGLPCDMDGLRRLAASHQLRIIEDGAQAHGAAYRGRRVGTLGDVCCFSFYPTKNLGACGDAGALVTDNDEVAQTARELRDHGQPAKYRHAHVGYNSRLDTVQAAALSVKLPRLPDWNEMRRERARAYDRWLAACPGLSVPACPEHLEHVYYLYVVQLEDADRDRVQARLRERGIGTGIHYPVPLHLTDAFSSVGTPEGTFPVAEQVCRRILSLPMYPELSFEAIEYVANTLAAVLRDEARNRAVEAKG